MARYIISLTPAKEAEFGENAYIIRSAIAHRLNIAISQVKKKRR